jgi:BMFP domain-containing protein YqiC
MGIDAEQLPEEDGNSAFEDFIRALGGLRSRRVRELLHWVQQQLEETAETGKAEWEESWQRHLKEMQQVREREDQKRSDRIARNREELEALVQRIEQLEEQLASRVQSAIPPDASSSAPQVSIERGVDQHNRWNPCCTFQLQALCKNAMRCGYPMSTLLRPHLWSPLRVSVWKGVCRAW